MAEIELEIYDSSQTRVLREIWGLLLLLARNAGKLMSRVISSFMA